MQAHAQRPLVVGSAPLAPQNEQLPSYAHEETTTVDYMNAIGLDSEPVSLQASDEEVDEAASARVVNFVACHGATPALVDNVNDSASTLAEIFRCFICLGKVWC